MSMGWSKKVDNDSNKYYKGKKVGKNTLYFQYIIACKRRGRNESDLAWIMLY